VQQVLYDKAPALVIEGIARRDSGTDFKENSAICFFYTNGHGHDIWGRLCSIFAVSGDLYVTLVQENKLLARD
jgi:hypothetical protein